ncbi:uncharacterized sodium-dependent transporter HI_0736-like isoform X2 [Anneissia japonica]|uniref:uncharacterized sodium-dependent transporter HI_0736-like isoform X2 n=1 Tax=Anneissia japonica TaxID=1529436 RepID=UPI0014256592|nr:uncharacterized sodium-dependent transporter HI_0736-like isoform X2 [Anneissia japonica]
MYESIKITLYVMCLFSCSAYYSVVLGWCFYFLFYYLANDLPDTYEESSKIFNDFALYSDWPVLFHFLAISFAALSIAWGVKSIEMVNTATVPIFLGLILFTFIWSLTLDQAAEGIKFLFTPDWDMLADARLWTDALIQNGFDVGAGWGLFLTYAIYMRADIALVPIGLFTPLGNNIVSLTCGMLTYATVFSSRLQANDTIEEIVVILKENGPANTGLTFIWFPLLYNTISGGRVLAILFFFALSLAGLSSMVANVELFVHNVKDLGVERWQATIGCSVVIFVIGVGSAVNLNFLLNQDFVWGFALIISGTMFLYMIYSYGVKKFRDDMFNTYSIDDWKLPVLWEWIVKFVAPLEAAVLLVWWAFDTISNDGDHPWYGFSPESFMSCMVQWFGFMVILITVNLCYVRYWRLPQGVDDKRDNVDLLQSDTVEETLSNSHLDLHSNSHSNYGTISEENLEETKY